MRAHALCNNGPFESLACNFLAAPILQQPLHEMITMVLFLCHPGGGRVFIINNYQQL